MDGAHVGRFLANLKKEMLVIVILVTGMVMTACSQSKEEELQIVEANSVIEQIQETEEMQTEETQSQSKTTTQETPVTQAQTVETMQNTAKIDMPILDEINQNVEIGTRGAYFTVMTMLSKE